MRSKVPDGKGKAAVAACYCTVGGVDDLYIDKGHRSFCFVDDLSLDESLPCAKVGKEKQMLKSETSPSERIMVSSDRVRFVPYHIRRSIAVLFYFDQRRHGSANSGREG